MKLRQRLIKPVRNWFVTGLIYYILGLFPHEFLDIHNICKLIYKSILYIAFMEDDLKIAIGCDHAAYEMKSNIADMLRGRGMEVLDLGTNGPDSVDYPDFAAKVSETVISGEADRGVLICGTGLGMSMAANKYKGIRAALCSEPVSARLSRQHNDSNVLCMGARMIGTVMAEEIVATWLDTPFEGGRHQRRVEKITALYEDGKESC